MELGNHHHYPIQHHFIYPPSKPGHITASLSPPTTPLRLPGHGSSLLSLWDLVPLPVQFLKPWLPNFPGVAMLPRGHRHALQGAGSHEVLSHERESTPGPACSA